MNLYLKWDGTPYRTVITPLPNLALLNFPKNSRDEQGVTDFNPNLSYHAEESFSELLYISLGL